MSSVMRSVTLAPNNPLSASVGKDNRDQTIGSVRPVLSALHPQAGIFGRSHAPFFRLDETWLDCRHPIATALPIGRDSLAVVSAVVLCLGYGRTNSHRVPRSDMSGQAYQGLLRLFCILLHPNRFAQEALPCPFCLAIVLCVSVRLPQCRCSERYLSSAPRSGAVCGVVEDSPFEPRIAPRSDSHREAVGCAPLLRALLHQAPRVIGNPRVASV